MNLDLTHTFENCLHKQAFVKKIFELCATPEEKYQKIIELGKHLSPYTCSRGEIVRNRKPFKKKLKGIADVALTKKMMEEGFFGVASKRLQQRVANLVILPHYKEAVWWFEKNRFEQCILSVH